MDARTIKRRLETLKQLCRERGIPHTIQRRIILEATLELDDHPTADRVHQAVVRRTAGVSRATVYRTLETLVELGVLTKTCHPGRMVRYDRRTEIHHHLICLRCDRVMDILDKKLDALPVPDTSRFGFQVLDHRVQLRGICRSCRKEEKRKS
jgi:Fur family transcriptional regulator, peroxide stress response regulator